MERAMDNIALGRAKAGDASLVMELARKKESAFDRSFAPLRAAAQLQMYLDQERGRESPLSYFGR
jgi:hypothetical protein